MFPFKTKTKTKNETTLRQTDAPLTEGANHEQSVGSPEKGVTSKGIFELVAGKNPQALSAAPLSPPPPSSSLSMNKDEGLDPNHPGAPAGEIRYAGLWIRTLALIADEILLFCVQMVPLAIMGITCLTAFDSKILVIGFLLSIPAILSGLLVQYWLYTAWFEHSKMSGTPGKFLFGLKVVDTKFKTLSFWQSTKRLLLQLIIVMLLTVAIEIAIYAGFAALAHDPDAFKSVSPSHMILLAFFMGTCVCLFNKRRQTLFDYAAHRFVIYSGGISKEPTWNEDQQQNRARNFLRRLKECAVISWRELPGKWLKIPVAIYVIGCLAFTACNLTNVVGAVWRIAQIEGVLDKTTASLPLPERLASLHIQASTARADYKRITRLVYSVSSQDSNWRKLLIERALQLDPYDEIAQTAKAEYDLKVAKDFHTAEKEYLKLANCASIAGQSTKSVSLTGAAECAANYDTKRAQYLVRSALSYRPFDYNPLLLQQSLDEKVGNKAALKEDARRVKESGASSYSSDWLTDLYDFQDDATLERARVGCEELLKKDKNCTIAHLILGQYFTIKKNSREAEHQYTLATIIDTRDPLPFVYRSDFYASENTQIEKAIADINKALAICQTEALLKKRADYYEQSGNVEKAKSDYNRVCQLQPDVENFTKFGEFLYKSGDTSLARKMADSAQAAWLNDTSLGPASNFEESITSRSLEKAGQLTSLCRLQHHLGDDQGALATLQRLLSVAPECSERASLFMLLNKDDQALAVCSADINNEIESEKIKASPVEPARKYLAKTFSGVPFSSAVFGLPDTKDMPGFSKDFAPPTDDKATLANLYCERGDCQFKRGDFTQAISDYDLAMSTSDSVADSYSDRRQLAYLLANGPKKTIAAVTSKIADGEYSADNQLYLSRLYQQIAEPAKAAACKKKAFAEIDGLIKDDPKDASNLWARGKLCMRTGEFQKALSDFSRAIAMNKDPAVSYYDDRARCYAALGRFDLAIQDADKAPVNTAVIPKAVSLFGKGSIADALDDFNTAVENDQFNADALYGRSQVYKKLGDKKSADRDLALATKYGYLVNPDLIRYNYGKRPG